LVQGIIFDSGDTLIRPLGGAWLPGNRFEEIVREEMPDLDLGRLEGALTVGDARLSALHNCPCLSLEAEREQFSEYYRLVLGTLGLKCFPGAVIDRLVAVYVDKLNVEPFPETREVLTVFRERGMLLGVLSNAWPSLDLKYRLLGLREYFQAFVISGEEGIVKPDRRIFAIASQRMELPPEELAFVDDSAEHVAAAIGLGFRGMLLDRRGGSRLPDLPTIQNLKQLLEMSL